MSCLDCIAVRHMLHLSMVQSLGVHHFSALAMHVGLIHCGHSTARVQEGLLAALGNRGELMNGSGTIPSDT